jgi:predicted SprT family Zn-dependent metalloprotease
MSSLPKTRLEFEPNLVRPQWFHPYLGLAPDAHLRLKRKELMAYAYDYFLKFLPFFKNQSEGSLAPGVEVKFSRRLKNKLGQAELFSHVITLNEDYFGNDPRLLPYSLYHELVHLWLYDCHLDPGHTRRFYRKMGDFFATGLPIDPDVHIHKRLPSEAKFVYLCDSCGNRWYVNQSASRQTICGYCHDRYAKQSSPKLYNNNAELRSQLRLRAQSDAS